MRNYILLLIIFIPVLLNAENDGGMPGDVFVSWGSDSRGLAMAGAITGLADDASSSYFNPACLSCVERHRVTFMHSMIYMSSNLSLEAISYTFSTKEIGNFGIGLLALHSSKIDRYPAEEAVPRGTFTYTNIAPMLTYALSIKSWFSAGISYKILYEAMMNESGVGHGLDLGLLLFPSGWFSFGVSGQNLISPSWTLINETQTTPISARIGFSFRPYRDMFAMCGDVLVSEKKLPLFHMGFEYKPLYSMAVRGGMDQYKFTYGVGLKRDMDRYTIKIDYAGAYHYESSSLLSPAHNISISFEFGGFRVRARTPKVAFSPMSEGGENLAWLVFETNIRGEVQKWEVIIKDRYRTPVRRMGAYGPPPYRIAWDGKDNNGIFVEDGNYYFEYRVTEERTERVYECEDAFVTLKTVGPKGTIIMTPMGEKPELIKEEIREKTESPEQETPPEEKNENETSEEQE